MNKVKQVKIELPPAKNPPVKYCTDGKRPDSSHFKLVPQFMPFLMNFVKGVEWNCQDKTLDVIIEETPSFDAYSWFGGINKRMAEAQKSSFVDLEEDSVSLVFQDENEKEICTIKFKGLQLVKHFCCLQDTTNVMIGNLSDWVCHSVTLKYSDSDVIKPKQRFSEEFISIIEATQKVKPL